MKTFLQRSKTLVGLACLLYAFQTQSKTVIKWKEYQDTTITDNFNSVTFINNTNGFAVGDGGAIAYTVDAGDNWTVTYGVQDFNYNSIQFPTSSIGYIVGSTGPTNKGILKTSDGGINWSDVSGTLSFRPTSVFFTDANTGYVVGYSGNIIKTTDGGTNWTMQSSGTTEQLNSVFFTSATNGFAVGNNGSMIKTIDGGNNWIVQTTGITNILRSVHFANELNGTAVGNKILLSTTDGGNTWNSKAPEPLGSFDFYSVQTINDSKVYVMGYLLLSPIILKSEDNLSSWEIDDPNLGEWNGKGPEKLKSMYFINDSIGFTVGEVGKIFKRTIEIDTTDSGTGGTLVNELSKLEGSNGSIFPNPFSESATLTITKKVYHTFLYDMMGRDVSSQIEISTIQNPDNTSSLLLFNKGLSKGVYTCKSILQDGSSLEKRLVID